MLTIALLVAAALALGLATATVVVVNLVTETQTHPAPGKTRVDVSYKLGRSLHNVFDLFIIQQTECFKMYSMVWLPSSKHAAIGHPLT